MRMTLGQDGKEASDANQAGEALWVKNPDGAKRDRQLRATVAALVGIAPKDELEGMMAAQLIAAHDAAMGWRGRCASLTPACNMSNSS